MSENNSNKYDETPLILVFYLDEDMMRDQPEVLKQFTDNMNNVIEQKNANIITIFLPTNSEERVECINPDLVGDDKKSEINELIDDIKNRFDMHSKPIPKSDDEEGNKEDDD